MFLRGPKHVKHEGSKGRRAMRRSAWDEAECCCANASRRGVIECGYGIWMGIERGILRNRLT